MITRSFRSVVRCITAAAALGLLLSLPAPAWAQGTSGAEEFDAVASANAKKNRKRQKRPVAMGTSGGNIEDHETEREGGLIGDVEVTFCNSGTLGALLEMKDGGTTRYFALSTNYAIAQTNRAKRNDDIVQPGLFDTDCERDLDDSVAELSGWKKIKFGGSKNTVDVAIAETVEEAVKKSGTIIGIGKPSSDPVNATVGMAVKKSGSGTGVTKGRVHLINATVEVPYPRSLGADIEYDVAIFKNQIVVVAKNPGQRIIAEGDSGSLLVQDKNNCPKPVGLVSAGNQKGDILIANKADKVLSATKKLKPKGKKTFAGCADSASSSSDSFVDPATRQALREAARVQRRAERQILEIPGISGVGLSLDSRDRAVITILLESDNEELRSEIPAEIEGIVTDVLVTGRFVAQ